MCQSIFVHRWMGSETFARKSPQNFYIFGVLFLDKEKSLFFNLITSSKKKCFRNNCKLSISLAPRFYAQILFCLWHKHLESLARLFSKHKTRAFEAILTSTFKRELGRQFLMYLLSLSFLSISRKKLVFVNLTTHHAQEKNLRNRWVADLVNSKNPCKAQQ